MAANVATDKARDFKDIEPKKGKKVIKIIIIIIVLLLIIGSLVSVLVFNVFNIRDEFLRGPLEAIPGVANLLPPLEYGELPLTVAELQTAFLELQTENAALQTQLEHSNALVASQASDIMSFAATIAELEELHQTFQEEREEFDRMIAGEVPQDFVRFFESINPDLAQELFIEIIGEAHANEELQNYVAMFNEMSARNASEILEYMLSANMELVLLILENLPLGARAAIITNMDVSNSSLIATMLAP